MLALANSFRDKLKATGPRDASGSENRAHAWSDQIPKQPQSLSFVPFLSGRNYLFLPLTEKRHC